MVDFLYGGVVDVGVEVMGRGLVDAVESRCVTMATAIPPPQNTPDGATPQCLNTVPSTNTHHPPDKMYQSPAAPFCLALKSFVGALWRPLQPCQKPQ